MAAKNGLALLLGVGDKEGNSEKVDLAQELIDAVNDKDAEAVAEAFSALYMACKEEHEDDDEESSNGKDY